MVSPIQQKKQLPLRIMEAIKRDNGAKYDFLVANLQLNTGFTAKTINKMLENMEKTGLISIKDNEIYEKLPEK